MREQTSRSGFRVETLTMPAAQLGSVSPLPALQRPGRDRFAREDVAIALAESNQRRTGAPDQEDPDAARRYGGLYDPPDCLPYAVLDGFDRQLCGREFKTVVLENEYLRATFLPELGGRIWSLDHKPSGKRLAAPNSMFQPTMLARRGAWISGGIEWNATPGGHSPQCVDPVFAARLTGPNGADVLRIYEWERIGRIAFQVDCWLPEGSPFLYARIRITNPHDCAIPMYWWTNIAADEAEDLRVVVPAEEALSWGYSGRAGTVPIPVIGGRDVSRPTRIPGCSDFYYTIPDGQRPWMAYLDGKGTGLVHASTSRLVGRKLFVWGTSPGGRHWQEFLSPGGKPYVELQAGIMHTQYTTVSMPAGADWSWVEAFGLIETDGRIVQGNDWQAAWREVDGRLNGILPQRKLETILNETREMSDRPSTEFIHRGSGWGALEKLRREQTGERAGWPGSLVFDDASLGSEQAPWLELLKTGAFPDPGDCEPVWSFQTRVEWRDMLSVAVQNASRDNWLAWLEFGVLLYNGDGVAADEAGAERAWQKSLAIKETPWAHRNMALAAWYAGRVEESVEKWHKAWLLRPDDIRLGREYGQALIRAGGFERLLSLLESNVALARDARMQVFRAICLLETGDPARLQLVEEYLRKPEEPVGTREGEPTLSRIFFELKARQLAAEEGVPVGVRQRKAAQDRFRCPAHLDFRQARDPKLNEA